MLSTRSFVGTTALRRSWNDLVVMPRRKGDSCDVCLGVCDAQERHTGSATGVCLGVRGTPRCSLISQLAPPPTPLLSPTLPLSLPLPLPPRCQSARRRAPAAPATHLSEEPRYSPEQLLRDQSSHSRRLRLKS